MQERGSRNFGIHFFQVHGGDMPFSLSFDFEEEPVIGDF